MKKRTIFWIIVLIIILLFICTDQSVQSNAEDQIDTASGSTQKCDLQEVEKTIITRNGTENPLVTKAFEITEGDLDFILTVEAESKWNPEAIGDRGNSKGLCQWHQRWQKSVRQDPNFSDPEWQLQKCLEFYRGYKEAGIIHKRLFGYNSRLKHAKTFEVKTVAVLALNCTE